MVCMCTTIMNEVGYSRVYESVMSSARFAITSGG